MNNPLDFTNKTVVITGGTRGIGFATAQQFLAHGADVVIFGSRAETVKKALEELGNEERTLGFHPNLSDRAALEETFAQIIAKFGHLDILINNAGIASSTKITDYGDSEVDKILDLNLRAVFTVTRAALPHLKESKGVILNTSSMVARDGQPTGILYPATKSAVNGLTKSLARELAKDGIRVNAVAPGIIETDMMKNVPESTMAPLIASIPLGRIGQPEDIANAFLFLASPLASYISGAVLPVDGLARS